MSKFTFTHDDGTTEDLFPQSYTDAAVATALAAVVPVVPATVTEVDVVESDGTTEKFVPETPAA